MHLEPGVEAALQECHVQELLEPSPHLNEQRMSSSEIQRGHDWPQLPPENWLRTRGWDFGDFNSIESFDDIFTW